MISLQNKRILVTREALAAEKFAETIRTYGGEPVLAPLIHITCLTPAEQTPLPEKIDAYNWVFFTSQNGVACFMNTSAYGHKLQHCRIAAVGSKTARAVESYGYDVDFMPSTYDAETMAKEFLAAYPQSGLILLIRGRMARHVLIDAFAKNNRTYHCLEVYNTVVNREAQARLQSQLEQQEVDYITFTSPSTVDAFTSGVDDMSLYTNLPVICIGRTTESRAKEQGFVHTFVPSEFTIEGMLAIMSQHIKQKG